MIYFFSLYVLKNFFAFPSRYRLYVLYTIAVLNFRCWLAVCSFQFAISGSLFPAFSLFNSASRCGQRFPFCFPKFPSFVSGVQRYEPFLFSQILFFLFFGPPFSLFPLCFATLRFLSCGLQRWGFFQSLSSVIFTFFDLFFLSFKC